MTIPATGAVSLQAIEDEFGGTGEISMSEYYRGNTYENPVSANNTNVPQSGAIKFGQFHGAEAKRYIQYKVLGAGGGGGYGLEDGTGSGRASSGGTTTMSASGFATVQALGGIGGRSGILSWSSSTRIANMKGQDATISTGYSEDFGTSSASPGQLASAQPGTGNAAGGTGGAGDNPSLYDESGGSGEGGRAGTEAGSAQYFSVGTVITYTIGAGGAPGSSRTSGAYGMPGYVVLISNGTEVVASGTSSTYTVV